MRERTEWAVVRAKVKRQTYAKLDNYCKREKTSISSFIRSLIEANIEGIVPLNQAGINRIEYNKKEDTFSWFLDFDNGPTIEVAEHLQPEFFENLFSSASSAMQLRNTYIKKRNGDSVPLPTQMKKLSGRRK